DGIRDRNVTGVQTCALPISAVVRSRVTPYLFILPAFAVYAAFSLYPLARAAQFSLYDWPGFGPSTFVGLGNYVDLAGDEAFRAEIGRASCREGGYEAGCGSG